MMARVLGGISVSLGWLAFVLLAVEARTQLASWLAGRDSHGPLIILFALIGWGILVTPQIPWAGFVGYALATGLMVLYVFDGGAGPLGLFTLAALVGALGATIWCAVRRPED